MLTKSIRQRVLPTIATKATNEMNVTNDEGNEGHERDEGSEGHERDEGNAKGQLYSRHMAR